MSDGPHLLYVEDEAGVREPTASSLREHGFRVTPAGTAAEGLAAWEADRADVILLDLGLPDRDGDLVIRRVRAESTVPILVISARSQEADKVRALEIGADDYMTKPFGLAELRARVAALLRRAGGAEADQAGIVRVGPLVLDPRAPRDHVQRRRPRPHAARVRAAQDDDRRPRAAADEGPAPASGLGLGLRGRGPLPPRLRQPAAPQAGRRRPIGRGERLIVAEPGVGYRIGSGDEAAGPTD